LTMAFTSEAGNDGAAAGALTAAPPLATGAGAEGAGAESPPEGFERQPALQALEQARGTSSQIVVGRSIAGRCSTVR
jgi:hypothetical protein